MERWRKSQAGEPVIENTLLRNWWMGKRTAESWEKRPLVANWEVLQEESRRRNLSLHSPGPFMTSVQPGFSMYRQISEQSEIRKLIETAELPDRGAKETISKSKENVSEFKVTRGELSEAAWLLAREIPLFGKFIGIFRDLDQIFRRGPRDSAALSDQVLERAAQLIQQFRVELEPKFTELETRVAAALQGIKALAEEGVTGPTVAYIAYLALLNDSIIDVCYRPDAEFAAWYLDAADLRFLIREYDHVPSWEEVRPVDLGLPWPTRYEVGYSLTRLNDFGFLLSEPAMGREPLARRVFKPDTDAIDDFTEHMGLVRPLSVSPGAKGAKITEAFRNGSRVEVINELKELLTGDHMPVAVVRRHLLDGFQWAVIEAGTKRGAFTGAFSQVAEAQEAADAELRRLELWYPDNWIPVAA